MKNSPNSASHHEMESWREWAKKSQTKRSNQPSSTQSPLITGLKTTSWESLPSPYKFCNSCRRIR